MRNRMARGSTSTAGRRRWPAVREPSLQEGADVGLAFDGDADRVLAVDERGEEVDGDRIIALSAIRMDERASLKTMLVVATVMANLGFRRALEERASSRSGPVGDKFVVEAMADRAARSSAASNPATSSSRSTPRPATGSSPACRSPRPSSTSGTPSRARPRLRAVPSGPDQRAGGRPGRPGGAPTLWAEVRRPRRARRRRPGPPAAFGHRAADPGDGRSRRRGRSPGGTPQALAELVG